MIGNLKKYGHDSLEGLVDWMYEVEDKKYKVPNRRVNNAIFFKEMDFPNGEILYARKDAKFYFLEHHLTLSHWAYGEEGRFYLLTSDFLKYLSLPGDHPIEFLELYDMLENKLRKPAITILTDKDLDKVREVYKKLASEMSGDETWRKDLETSIEEIPKKLEDYTRVERNEKGYEISWVRYTQNMSNEWGEIDKSIYNIDNTGIVISEFKVDSSGKLLAKPKVCMHKIDIGAKDRIR